MNSRLDKFQRMFFVLSAQEKIRRLVEHCDICLSKERSIKSKMGPHEPSTVGSIVEKVFIDLVTLSETVRKNHYLLTVQDGFTKFASAYSICNKEASTIARVLICEHFSVFGLPNQIHSDNGCDFVDQLWQEQFLELPVKLITQPSKLSLAKSHSLQPSNVKQIFQCIGYIQYLKQTRRWNYQTGQKQFRNST